MSMLPNILPTANVAAFPHREAAGFSGAAANPGEAFDQLMNRALAPVDPKIDAPTQPTLPTQTSAKDLAHLTNPATAATVTVATAATTASIAPDFIPSLDQSKATSSKPSADHLKSVTNKAAVDPTLIPQSDDKTASIPLPSQIAVVPASVPAEANPTVIKKSVVANITSSFGKSVSPTAGKISNQIGLTQKNSNPIGTPTVSLPIVMAASNVASNDVAEKVADSIAKLSPTQTVPAQKSSPTPTSVSPVTKDISAASAKASISEVAQNPPTANQPIAKSSNSSRNNYSTVVQKSVPLTVTVVSTKAASAADSAAKMVPTTSQSISPATSPTVSSALITATTKNNLVAPTQVSSSNAVQIQAVASQPNLPETEVDATSDTAIMSPIADVTVNTVMANAIAVAAETVSLPVTIPVAVAGLPTTNQSTEKNVSKVKTDNVAKNTTANTVVSDVKTDTATRVTAKTATATDSKTTTTSPVTASVTTPANSNTTISSSPDDSKTAKVAVKTVDEKSGDNFSQPTLFSGATQPTAGATIAAPPQSVDDGTSVAKQDVSVSDGEKANKTEGSTGKILPGSGAPMMRGNDLPVRTEQFATTAATIAATQDSPATTTTAAVERMANPAVDDLNLQTMERTHELVALHAMRLNDVGTGSLQLVIKPGAGTQLSLELRQRENGIEAQAVLQQGDFKHLNQHWPELQQRLEQRGIKLAALTDDAIANHNGGSNGSSMFEQKQNQSVAAFAGYDANVSAAGTFTSAKTRVITHEGWETWA